MTHAGHQWSWVSAPVIFATHDILLKQHGGLPGINNRDAVMAALARPQQLDTYGEPPPDGAALAAAYAYGLTRGHGFADGNKRIGLFAALFFLGKNGFELVGFDKPESVVVMNKVAAGDMDQATLAAWFRSKLVAFPHR